LLAATRDTWRRAADGRISLVTAALTTDAAFAGFAEIGLRSQVTCDSSFLEALRNQIQRPGLDFRPWEIEREHPKSAIIALIDALQQHLKLLLDFKADCLTQRCDQTTNSKELPSLVRLCFHETPESASTVKGCLTVALQNIGHHLQTSCRCSRIIR
jgi:hypothetical protein